VRVALVARNRTKLEERAARYKGSVAIVCDVTDERSVEQAVYNILRDFNGAPDILVNNAGIFRVATVEETPVDVFSEMIATNLVGPFLFARAFTGRMRERKSGHVVTIGSIADRTIFTGNAAYSAAKFGLRAIHEVMRAELKGTGVRASLISPAATDTEIWQNVTVTDPVGAGRTKRPMLNAPDVVAAVMFALTQPEHVNVDELRLSHS
jgi:NADP-dependent 3-hydroxy acid dehydrogenase YdfG